MLKKKFIKCIGLVLAFAMMFSSTVFAGAAQKGFFDCKEHWAVTEIDVMTKAGVVNGVGGNRFNPDGTVTRAEFVSMAARAIGIEGVAYNNAYKDITGSEWYAPVVQAAYDAKLINSGMISNGNFEADLPITRQEMASIIMGAYDVMSGNPYDAADLSAYVDLNEIHSWAINDLKGAVSLGIMNGVTDTKLEPLAYATRAEAVVMLFRLFNYAEGNLMDGDFGDENTGWQCTLRTAEETLKRKNPIGKVEITKEDGNFAPGCVLYDIEYSGDNYVNSLSITNTFKKSDGGNVLEKGKSYHLSFYSKVEGLDSYVINQVYFSMPSDRDVRYTEVESLTVYGSEWNHYHLYFDATETVEEARMLFWAGGDRLNDFKLYFDDFRLEEAKSYVPVGVYCDDEFAGKVNISSGGTYEQGETVNISASVKPGNDYLFSGWSDAYGNVVSENSDYSIEASGNVLMKANFSPYTAYGNGFTVGEGELDCSIDTPVLEDNKVTVSGKLTVPKGWLVVDAGAVILPGEMKNGLNIFTDKAIVVRPQTVNGDGTFTVSKNTDKLSGDFRTRAFAVVKDLENNIKTFYSDIELYNAPEKYEKTHYKLAYNHELLVTYVESASNAPWKNGWVNAADWYASFIGDIENTDVDVVMFCPGLWRTCGWDSDIDTTLREPIHPDVTEKPATVVRHREAIEKGIDPVGLTLAGAEEYGKDIFGSFRMNDYHNTNVWGHISHNKFWREHPEYWLYDSDLNLWQRLYNYMVPEVRDFYYSMIEEFLTRYDVDGIELDFQRSLLYFYPEEVEKGIPVMTDFVGRIRSLLDRIGEERGKYLSLSVRIPETIEDSLAVGLDPVTWDKLGYVDILNISMENPTTLELDVEGYMENTENSDILAELGYFTYTGGGATKYTTNETYAATIYNYLERGIDGFSVFNMNWLHANKIKSTPALHNILNLNTLKKQEKHYVMGTHYHKGAPSSRIFPATGQLNLDMLVPDDTSSGIFKKALLWVEMEFDCTEETIEAYVNGTKVDELPNSVQNLFAPPIDDSYVPALENIKLYSVPLSALVPGNNSFEIKVTSEGKCGAILGVELGLYHDK